MRRNARPSSAPGHEIRRPTQISWRGWKQIAKRVALAVFDEHYVVIGAGLAFFALLSVFPLLIAVVSLYGLVSDPTVVEAQIHAFSTLLPEEARAILTQRLGEIVSASPEGLGLGVVLSLLGSLWAGSQVVTYLFSSLNVAYGEPERRSYFKLKAMALLFTLGLVAFVILSVGLVAILPALAGVFGLGEEVEFLLALARWPLLTLAIVLALAILFRYGPTRKKAKWQWLSPGAVFATLAWLAVSALFSFYVSNFGNFNEIYGSIGAVIVLMLWFFLSCFLILVGAKINAAIEHQTEMDSTIGNEKPMGRRGADTPPPKE